MDGSLKLGHYLVAWQVEDGDPNTYPHEKADAIMVYDRRDLEQDAADAVRAGGLMDGLCRALAGPSAETRRELWTRLGMQPPSDSGSTQNDP